MHKWWAFVFGTVLAAEAGIFVVAPIVGWWLPPNVSTFGGTIDGLFYFILAITGFFFLLTEGMLVYNICQYTGGPGQKGYYIHGHHKLEVFWTAVPAAILVLISLVQIKTWADIKYPTGMPKPEQVLEVSARQFEWRMRYPRADELERMLADWKGNLSSDEAKSWEKSPHFDDIHVVNEIHVWKNANVRVYLKTRDVLHSFYLPNLRLKQDAVPGKTIPVWFNVTESNTEFNSDTGKWEDGGGKTGKERDLNLVWDMACAELCGWGHYKMQGRLYVHKDKDDFLNWLKHAQEEQNRAKP